jgi:hypothetical protein
MQQQVAQMKMGISQSLAQISMQQNPTMDINQIINTSLSGASNWMSGSGMDTAGIYEDEDLRKLYEL